MKFVPKRSPKIHRERETILLVEDNDEIRKLAKEFLEKQGYGVLEACQGEDGLFLCQQHRGRIHLMLTDVMMPGMNGQKLAERLLALRPGMKVVYMSGYPIEGIAYEGVLEAKTPFLQKPFKLNAFARKVREALDSPG